MVLKNQQSLLKKAVKSNSLDSATQICQSKKTSQLAASLLELVTTALPPKTSLVLATGLVRHGERVFLVADKSVHELEVEFTEWKTQQKHIVKRVDELHSDMTDVKKAVFQAKWMLVGGIIFAGLMNSDVFVSMLMNLGTK
jgi:hypothetical protein